MSLSSLEKRINKQGKNAELQVSSILHSLGSEYFVFDNVLLETKGGTTQIDHIVISPYGIFVIETKSHKGIIYGDDNSKYWIQLLGRCKRFTFYSPYKQNYGHLRNLYRLLNLTPEYFLGIICFTNEGVDLSKCYCSRVTHISKLYNIIISHRTVLFTQVQLESICKVLCENNKQSKYMDKKHIAYVKSMK